ncbi:NAD-dependent epimerase/dehydratase family protein [Ereboglobus luteus]|uniref:CDP-tyvelose epimerase n=1 Tax=Ereboglobus luteus TaxID=1796921 RepID=A0A2U8E1S0_9BACT|nr:NAD-dependent epimerase/dehydratase family protein [Ereboglobus luteus]AWI08829.1 CDP-tyvelose epimerase [Ereboglobus luteus]
MSKILISGICGFVGVTLASELANHGHTVFGFDNFIRPGSETNRARLKAIGVRIQHGDIRVASDLETLPPADFVIDAAANPSVLAGVDGKTSTRQLVEHNLCGTINLLEYCKRHKAGFILLSTSRVYSIPPLAALPVEVHNEAYRPATDAALPAGISANGVSETFSTLAPVSLYGATKLASETLGLEYGETFALPVYINRCGVLAGAGQFGRADQGIFSYWINSYLRGHPLKYIGFDGQGHQVRDCLHPKDLVPLLLKQIGNQRALESGDRIINCAGGSASAMSLRQLSAWCAQNFEPREIDTDPNSRPFDIPWMVLDSTKAARLWDWRPATTTCEILGEIAAHAHANPNWLDVSAAL